MEEKKEMKEITYGYIQKHGIWTNSIIVKLTNKKNQVIFEKSDKSTEIIAKGIDVVSLYGAPFQPVTMVSGVDITHPPYFIGIITEGILQVYDYVYTTENQKEELKNLNLFVIIT